jgi:phosphoglycolate phosphatase
MKSTADKGSRYSDKSGPLLPELVVWDIDRTLLDAGPATHTAFQAALRTVAPVGSMALGPHLTGRTDPAVAREVLLAHGVAPGRCDRLVREALAALPAQFGMLRGRFLAEGRVLPGAREVLQALDDAGVRQTVLTGNIRANALFKLELFGLTGRLDLAMAAYGDDAERREDLPALVLQRAERCRGRRLDRGRIWLVGDTPGDLSCAREAGVRCLLVATGLYRKDELARLGPDGVLDDLADHRRVVDLLCGR